MQGRYYYENKLIIKKIRINGIQLRKYPRMKRSNNWRPIKQLCCLDVREAAEYANAHIPGSINLPLSQV